MYNEENYQVSEEEKWQIQPHLKGKRRAGKNGGLPKRSADLHEEFTEGRLEGEEAKSQRAAV